MSEELFDRRLCMEAEELLSRLGAGTAAVAFLDPQYRGVMDKLKYGNEGARQKERAKLPQMTEEKIAAIVRGIDRVLRPSGHLFLWIDKFHLCEGVKGWLEGTALSIVDLITWDKRRVGMGYRTRRQAEYLLVLQKEPLRAKGVWNSHSIRDIWPESDPLKLKRHPHAKPVGLLRVLVEATTRPGDLVVDPAAGSFVVLDVARALGRCFAGCDLVLLCHKNLTNRRDGRLRSDSAISRASSPL